ncbi:MAG: hypothetical protein H8D45_11425 [Bacteroidetes bacterium]|nr:hypothetical protein [Bacteroidota bacterium]MBL7104360.1 hypothetical protein [Bacteroidales bacterium]
MKKIYKISIIAIAFIALVLLAFNLFFGYLIKLQVANLSKDKIHLEYKKAGANIFIGSVEFTDVVLKFNEVSIDTSSSIYIRSLSFSELSIDRINLIELFFNKNFKVQKIKLFNPEIELKKDTIIQKKDFFSKVLTPEVIKKKSQSSPFSFDIEELEIKYGAFQYLEGDDTEISFDKINILIRDLQLSDLAQLKIEKNDLDAHFRLDVNLYNHKQKINKEYYLTIDSIVYHSEARKFMTGGISFLPVENVDFEARPVYSAKTDKIIISGFALKEFIANKDLKFEKILISDTKFIETKYQFIKKTNDSIETASKTDVLFNMIKEFYTDTFQLEKIYCLSINKEIDTILYIDNANVLLLDVSVDSSFISGAKYLTLTENSSVTTGRLKLHLTEPEIDFQCDSFVYSGPEQLQYLKDIRFKYSCLSKNGDKQEICMDILVNSLVLNGLNTKELINSQVADFSLFVKNPNVKIYDPDLFKFKNHKKKKFDLPDKIVLNEFVLENGSFYLFNLSEEMFAINDLNFSSVDLEIKTDLNKQKNYFEYQSFETSFNDLKFISADKSTKFDIEDVLLKNHSLSLHNLTFSKNKLEKISSEEGVKYKIDTSKLEIKKLFINQFDIQKVINQREFIAEDLLIEKPQYYQFANAINTIKDDSTTHKFSIEKLNNELGRYLKKLNIAKLNLSNGNFIYRTANDITVYRSGYDLQINDLQFGVEDQESGRHDISPGFLHLNLFDTKLSSNSIYLTSDSILYNTLDNNVTLKNLIVRNSDRISVISKNQKSVKYEVRLPLINLYQLDPEPESGAPVSFQSVDITSPHIFVGIPQKRKNKNEKAKNINLPTGLITDYINIEDGKIRIYLCIENDTLKLNANEFNFSWHKHPEIKSSSEVGLNNDDLMDKLNFMFSGISATKKNMTASINSIDFNNLYGKISVNKIEQAFYSGTGSNKETKNKFLIEKVVIDQPQLITKDGNLVNLKISKIDIPDVDINLVSDKKKPATRKHLNLNDTSLKKLFNRIEYVQIDSTIIDNIHIRHTTQTDTIQKHFDINRISFFMDGFRLDSSLFDSRKTSFAKDIIIRLHDREIITKDSMYLMKTNNLTYDYNLDKIVLDSVEIVPRYANKQFFDKAKYQTDRIEFRGKNITIDGINIRSLLEDSLYHLDKITLNQFRLYDYRDKKYPLKPGIYKKMPQQILNDLPAILMIDTIQVNDSYILYGEYVDKSSKPGEIYFDDFNASIYNLSNVFKVKDTNYVMKAVVNSKIMNDADMTVELYFPLSKSADYFRFNGKVENLDLTKFNSMTENLFGISIVKGNGRLDIPSITGNNKHSEGELTLRYKRFKLALYSRKKVRLHKGIGSEFIDLMLNDILIKSNNPEFLGKIRKGEVYFNRDTKKSILNYIWKSVMSGTLSTMGFNTKEQRKEKKK